jgi:hypothetical protein
MRIVEMAADGLVSVLLTGKGEPCLYTDQIYDYLGRMEKRFPLVDLQTNGYELSKMPDGILKVWSDKGLTLVCISVAHFDPKISNEIMRCPDASYDYWDAVKKIQDAGLACRINCTMVKGGVEITDDVDALINKCSSRGVDQLTIRPVAKPAITKARGPFDWVCNNQPEIAPLHLYDYLDERGTELLQLPHGAVVFDVQGQNVCVGNCITSTTDPNDIRQIIFFPDGRIAYDWKYNGARIL